MCGLGRECHSDQIAHGIKYNNDRLLCKDGVLKFANAKNIPVSAIPNSREEQSDHCFYYKLSLRNAVTRRGNEEDINLPVIPALLSSCHSDLNTAFNLPENSLLKYSSPSVTSSSSTLSIHFTYLIVITFTILYFVNKKPTIITTNGIAHTNGISNTNHSITKSTDSITESSTSSKNSDDNDKITKITENSNSTNNSNDNDKNTSNTKITESSTNNNDTSNNNSTNNSNNNSKNNSTNNSGTSTPFEKPDLTRLTSIFNALQGCYMILDTRFHIAAVNDGYAEATLTKREQIVGRYVFEVFPNNPSEANETGEFNLDMSLKRVLRTGEKDTMAIQKYPIRTPTGEFIIRYWSCINTPVFNEAGEIIYINHRAEDVTKLVTTETRIKELDSAIETKSSEIYLRTLELREKGNQLDSIVNSTGDWIAAIDSKGLFTVLNAPYQKTFMEVLGVKIKVGMSISDAFATMPEIEQKWRRALGEEEFTVLESFNEKQGLSYYELRYNVIRDKDGVMTGVCNLGRNVTERIKMEADLKKAKEDSEVANHLKSKFFQNVSHEFRTPLTLILGPVETLLSASDRTEESRKQRQTLETIQRNSLRLLKLVNSVLDFSRLEADRQQATFEPVDIAKFIVELASAFSSEFTKNGLEYLIETPQLSQHIFVDKSLLEKIVLNLISNAFKFTKIGGVTVKLSEEHEPVNGKPTGCAVLEVEDTGFGIPAAELPYVWERFHRVQNAQTQNIEGTGIGLSLVHECVTLHKGQITVESQEGRGTKFKVKLPMGKDHLPPERVSLVPLSATEPTQKQKNSRLAYVLQPTETKEVIEKPKRKTSSSKQATIVLAEDNTDMTTYIQELLAPHYHVIAAGDGLAALEVARKTLPDLILTDVMMPRLDGFGLLKLIREDSSLKLTSVIMLSAHAGEEARVTGLQASADDYLVKPFSARELLARISTHLELGKLRKTLENQVVARTKELQIAYEKLHQKSVEYKKLQEEFIDSVCHEVRNPLNVIYSGVDLLKQDLSQLSQHQSSSGTHFATALAKIKDLAETIELSAKLQKSVVDDVLVYSKWENNPAALTLSIFNPKEIFIIVQDLFRNILAEKQLSLKLELPTEDIIVTSDSGLLKQILVNLVANAIKFTDYGAITLTLNFPTIKTKDQITTLTFTVSDTGLGMDHEEQKLIFERFSQTLAQTKVGRGFGLGLAICKKMVESMGGLIQVESKKGEGSKFRFHINCTANVQLVVEEHNLLTNVAPAPKAMPLNILVVDDNPLNQKVLVTHLTRVGHHCQTASNGSEAVQLWDQCEFSVILMDVIMPIMDGFQATINIRQIEKERKVQVPVYIIGISGNARDVYGDNAVHNCGMNDYLTKPYQKDILYEKLNEYSEKLRTMTTKKN